jgi:hypothetical protein
MGSAQSVLQIIMLELKEDVSLSIHYAKIAQSMVIVQIAIMATFYRMAAVL